MQGDGSISVPNSVSSPQEVTKPCSYNMVEAIPTCGVLAKLSGTNPTFQAIHWMPVLWLRVDNSCHSSAKLPPQSGEQIPFFPGKSSYKNQPLPPLTLSIKCCLCNSNNPHCWQVQTKFFNITVPGAIAEGY